MHPGQPSKARLGGVHFIFRHIQICNRLLQGELFKVTMYTAHISSNGSHFLTARVLVYWIYKVSKLGYGRTKWMVTMYFKYTAHISSNWSHFLTARVFVYWTYEDNKFAYGQTKWMVTMYSNYTAHISSNGSHFLTARVLLYWTYKVSWFGHGRTKWMVTMYSKYTAHNKLKWKPLFDGLVFCVLNV